MSTESDETQRYNIEFPEFAIERMRLKSYDEWPISIKQTPKQLSDAGFFYTLLSDRVICFSCGGGLREWREEDDPFEQHALWYEHCSYVKLIKGPEYVAATKEKFRRINQNNDTATEPDTPSASTTATSSTTTTASVSTSSSPTSSIPPTPPQIVNSNDTSNLKTISTQTNNEDEENDPNESRLCNICYTVEFNTAFFPCGHVFACAKCASSQTKCPLCRKPFESIRRIYLP